MRSILQNGSRTTVATILAPLLSHRQHLPDAKACQSSAGHHLYQSNPHLLNHKHIYLNHSIRQSLCNACRLNATCKLLSCGLQHHVRISIWCSLQHHVWISTWCGLQHHVWISIWCGLQHHAWIYIWCGLQHHVWIYILCSLQHHVWIST